MEINISTNQLLPTLQVLPRADKLGIVQFLVLQLAQEEGVNSSVVTNNDLDWKLYNTSNAADTLLNMLMEDKFNCQNQNLQNKTFITHRNDTSC